LREPRVPSSSTGGSTRNIEAKMEEGGTTNGKNTRTAERERALGFESTAAVRNTGDRFVKLQEGGKPIKGEKLGIN